MAEVEAEGGQVSIVAQRHGISKSLLYNWRSAWKAAGLAARARAVRPTEFVHLGIGFAAPAERLQHRAAVTPLLDAFFVWAQNAERKLSARSELAEALRYIIRRRTALTRFATDARLEADNNIAENAIRGIALGRRNWLFAGSHSGGERAAAMYSILQTAKLNGVNPEAYLTDTLSKIAAGHPINRISELMPWAYQSATSDTAA